MKIFFLLYFLFLFHLSPKETEIEIGPVYYLDENYNWMGPAKVQLRGKKILKIYNVNSNANKYLTPSFCDAQVTLSMNAMGGGNDKDAVLLGLKSLLAHGFTHALASFEPDWVKKYYSELVKKKTIVPNLYFSDKAILPITEEYPNLPSEIYFTADKKDSLFLEVKRQTNSNLPVLLVHRYHSKNRTTWTSKELYKIFSESRNSKIVVSSFGDKISILDTLLSGGKYLQHPIPLSLERNIQKEHLANLHWMPLLNVYSKLDIAYKEEIEEYKKTLESHSPYYKKYYLERFKDFSFRSPESSEYEDYIKFYQKKHQSIFDIILGSGSGNLLSLPGISGLEELQILYQPEQNENAYLKMAIQNSCQYLGISEKREIKEGKEIDMVLFSKNPGDPTHLFSIEKVFYRGEILSETPRYSENK